MKNNVIVCTVVLSALLLNAACGSPKMSQQIPLLPQHAYGDSLRLGDKREQLHQFILDRLSGEKGVFTNYKDTDQAASLATGHEMLSESAGLSLRYYALTRQQAQFDSEWARTKQTFNLGTGFSYRYAPASDKRYSLNAAVDDLRIIRALHEAGNVFKKESYDKEAEAYGSRFYKYNVKDGLLYDFYDETYHTTNDFVTLCYIDLKTLRLLPISPDKHRQLEKNMLSIIKKGYLSDHFPFYETRFQYRDGKYSSENINMIESLLTVLTLTEIGDYNPRSVEFIREQVKNGILYGQYTREGEPLTDIQSTAIYAIAAMIGSQIEDKQLYEDSINRMNQFQVRDANSPLNGGFGDPGSEQAYSFDNLMAQLAYAY